MKLFTPPTNISRLLHCSNLRKWLRSSNLVSSLYYELHIDDLPIVLGIKSYDKKVEDVIIKYLPNATEPERRKIKKDIKRKLLN